MMTHFNIRILYLYKRLSPPANFKDTHFIGGAQKRTIQLAKLFKKNGAEVIIGTDDPANSIVVKDLKDIGIKHYRIPFFKNDIISIITSLFKLIHLIKKEKIDIIHSHHRRTTVISFIVTKITKKKMIHNARLTFDDKRYFGKFSGNNIIAVSSGVKRNLIKKFNIESDRITVIYNGLSIEMPSKEEICKYKKLLNIKNDEIVISVIGRLSKQKGHKYLIRALPKIINKSISLKIIFVGGEATYEYGIEKKLKMEAKRLQVNNMIIFMGHQDYVEPFIELSEFTVLPSLREGLPGAAIESLLMEKPVVATRIGGTTEVIENEVNGLLVEPKNSEALADSILYMIENKKLAKKMGEKGRKIAEEKFSVQKMFENYRKYYSTILENRI
ncbi:hypothetical protein C6A36_00050 [Desulfobacteraceae bacterium SEEP-SAG10]|nr:hypothetical protein C6A36_00050 [Desulfobacteraceae bacterium SEEP-SAG10]